MTCTKCSRTLDSLALTVAPDGNVYCKVIENHLYLYVLHKLKKKIDFNSFSEKKNSKVCHKVVTAPERPQIITDTSQIPADDEKDGCPRCGGKVLCLFN